MMSNPTENAVKLNKTVPKNWEKVFGYPGEAEWLSAYWTPMGDEAEFDDGRLAGTADWQVYQWLFQQIRPELSLAMVGVEDGIYALGSSENNPTYCLLMNLENRQIFVAPIKEARILLKKQHPPAIPMTRETIDKVYDQIVKEWERQVEEAERVLNNSVPCQACGMTGWKLNMGKWAFEECSRCKGRGLIVTGE